MEETDDVIRYYKSKSDNGDSDAQFALGHFHFYGLRGFEQNYAEALHYLELAAQQNHLQAYGTLGHWYSRNELINNPQKSVYL